MTAEKPGWAGEVKYLSPDDQSALEQASNSDQAHSERIEALAERPSDEINGRNNQSIGRLRQTLREIGMSIEDAFFHYR